MSNTTKTVMIVIIVLLVIAVIGYRFALKTLLSDTNVQQALKA